MKIKVIAIIIIFILLFSYSGLNNLNNVNNVNNMPDSSSNSDNYYIINNSTSTHINCINNELNIFTDNSIPSYLEENLSYCNETLYSFNLSWNCYGNNGDTEDNIIIKQNNETLIKMEYGKQNNKNTYITGKTAFKNIIKLNKMNYNYSINFIFDKNIKNYVYLFIKSSSFEMPLKIQLMNKYNYNNISILFGGKHSNQTISKINVKKYNKIIEPSNKNIKFKSNIYNIKNNFYIPLNSSVFIDNNINSLIYINSNYDVILYNYYNNSFDILYNNKLNNISYSSSIKLKNNIIYYFYNGNINIIKINLFNLSLDSFELKSYNEKHLLYYNNSYILYNKNSYFTIYKNNKTKNISLNSKLISVNIKNNINIITYNISKNSIYYFDINNKYNLNFIKNITIYNFNIKYISANNGLSSIIYNNFTAENILNNIFYNIKNINNNLLYSKYLYIYENNKTYNTSIIYKNNVSYNSNTIIMYNDYNIIIYNTTFLYSKYYIKINSEKQKIYFNKTLISFNVTSKLSYKLFIKTNDKNFELKNKNFTYIKNINYNSDILNATAINLAGYIYKSLYNFTYDNKIPLISTNPGNNSFIKDKYNISFNVSLKFIKIYFNSTYFHYSFNKNSTLKINLSNFYGILKINATLINIYNIKFNYTLIYRIININLSSLNLNIHNNEYFNKKYINLTWNYIYNASLYKIIINNNTVITKLNYYNITLSNGNYNITFIIKLINNTSIIYNKYMVHIITYGAKIKYYINSLYFSFSNNSMNSSINLIANTNMSSLIYININSDNKTFYNYSNNYINLSIKNLYLRNGYYNITIIAKNIVNIKSYKNITIYVNNSIPEKILLEKNKIYTDKSTQINILNYNKSLEYYYIINNNTINYNKNITFNNNGIYKIKIMDENKYGSYNFAYITIYNFKFKPEITLNYKVINNNIILNYTFNDIDNHFNITLNNGTVNYYNITSYTFNITEKFYKNGLYYANLTIKDIFGNTNFYNKTFGIQYFVKIYNLKIENNKNTLYLKINGKNTENITIEWFINNKYYSSGYKIKPSLPVGIDKITAEIHYNDKTIYVNKKIIVLGNIPYYISVIFISIIIFIFIFNNFYYNNKDIKNIIENLNGKTIKDAIKEAKKNRISKHYLMSEIKLMEKNNKLSIENDLDNQKFILLKNK